ncbi:MAG: flagellar basal body rod protein FlgB [Peptoclostridium sp.]|uniref:flagellar basal body rod protein FlgB n=1 Tax=Peptoclostridium sp. TaxID=1904860 RepID=UPI00139C44D3|nr:flagellar basal body rod protein FlgB [Peptoclostridium sp.]MZQ75117.1 flagellar basal body rod protein FlgB [Peptoclostridium sp.]
MVTKGFEIFNKALDYYWERSKVIDSNIANINTPEYKRKDVVFSEVLKDKQNSSAVEGYATNERHIKINPSASKLYEISVDKNTRSRIDGNNVDLDLEMIEQSKNSISYNTSVEQMQSMFKRLKSVIGEGRR